MKNRSISLLISLCALIFVMTLVSGCEDASDTTMAPVITSPSYPQLSPIEPPAPKYEPEPVLASPETTIWKKGYWAYNGGDFEWVDGEVIARPAPTAVWYPSYWGRREYGWAFVPGYWQ